MAIKKKLAKKKTVAAKKVSTTTLTPSEQTKFLALVDELKQDFLAKLAEEKDQLPDLPNKLKQELIKRGREFTKPERVSATILDGLVEVSDSFYVNPYGHGVDWEDKEETRISPKATKREKMLLELIRDHLDMCDLQNGEVFAAAKKSPTLNANAKGLKAFIKELTKLQKTYYFLPDDILDNL